MRTVTVNGDALTIEDVVDVARGAATAELAPGVAAAMEPSRSVVAAAIEGDAPVYGVNTGFGALADTSVGARDLEKLQGAIVRSHAAGTGEPLDDAAVRAVLLLRARTLAAGYSGVRVDLPARLIEMLGLGLLPVVPGKGSVGASGDLAQLAHLAQTLIGEGRLRGPGDPLRGRPAAEVLAEHGIVPLQLAPKEGLSLVNGTEPMQALLAFSIIDAEMLVRAADLACALSIEALLGTDRPYDERVQALRPHPGQLDSAANLRALLAGSPLLASHRHSRHAVQDAYCLRCAPQVHGAVRDVLGFARGILETELGAVVDNPVVVPDGEVMTTGNFHGEPLAFAADMLAMAIAELGSISERRVDRMLDPAFSAACRRSWRRTRGPTRGSCSRSTRPRPWSARTRCSRTRQAWTRSRPRASRKTMSRWGGPGCGSCVRWSRTCGPAWRWRCVARRRGSTCGRTSPCRVSRCGRCMPPSGNGSR